MNKYTEFINKNGGISATCTCNTQAPPCLDEVGETKGVKLKLPEYRRSVTRLESRCSTNETPQLVSVHVWFHAKTYITSKWQFWPACKEVSLKQFQTQCVLEIAVGRQDGLPVESACPHDDAMGLGGLEHSKAVEKCC
eukprot:m.263133 g.263133  ORF g.263133 m.263133 type:complete len:138 (+) comp15598_c1_seq3:138-551(+)